jgi:hypothetical protein
MNDTTPAIEEIAPDFTYAEGEGASQSHPSACARSSRGAERVRVWGLLD